MSLLGWSNIATAVLLMVAVGFGLFERNEYLGEKSARSQDLAAAQAMVLAAQQADAVRTRRIEDEHAAEVAALREQAHDREVAIAQAPVTTGCVVSPAMRALFDSLRIHHSETRSTQSESSARTH